jgi:hypothetical protein
MRSYGTGTIAVSATSGSLQPGTIQIVVNLPVAVKPYPSARRVPNIEQFTVSLQVISGAAAAARISYYLPRAGFCRLSICNLNGQTIRILEKTTKQPGSYSALWDGKDSQGLPTASGTYLVMLQADGVNKSGRIQVSR